MTPTSGPDDLDHLRQIVQSRPRALVAYQDAVRREALLATMVSARDNRALTQRAVARSMGTTQSAVSDLETGRSDPRLSSLQRYARALGLRLHVRLVDTENGPTAQA
ncbi:MAG: hypothetical protein DLM59_07630 [Pseudonocardiales bacterium]|nr:MAG: hypothetical protein DLM59_07630 [Pseudonocardiales bacterium]